MTDFVLHGIPGSPYVRTVALALEEKRLPWRLAAVAMGAHRAPEYRAIHPFHKIPTIDHGDYRLYETPAILRYLDRMADAPALVPDDAKAVARMDQMISIAACYVAPRISGALSFPRMVAPMIGMPVDEAALAAAIEPAAETLDEIAGLLGEKSFIAGDAISLADLMLAPHISFLPDFEEGRRIMAPHANLTGWIARMEARPSMAATTWERMNALAAPETVAA